MPIIGTTKLSKDGKISLIKNARTILNVTSGDIIVFSQDKQGKIIITKG